MKKLFLSMAVALMTAGALTSCNSKSTAESTADEGEALKVKIENCTDPDSLKIYVDQAQEYAKKLEAEGKGEEAEAYLNKLVPTIQTKDPSVASYFEELKSKAKEEINDAKENVDSVANAAVDDAKAAGENAVNAAKTAGENVVNSAKEKGAEAVEAAKNAGENAVEKGKEKTSEAVQKGADKVKNLLK